jgi:hypothetical protein
LTRLKAVCAPAADNETSDVVSRAMVVAVAA